MARLNNVVTGSTRGKEVVTGRGYVRDVVSVYDVGVSERENNLTSGLKNCTYRSGQ